MGYPRVAPISMPVDPATLGYLAGLLDGEGNITIGEIRGARGQKRPSHGMSVAISNCDLELMGWLAEVIGGGVSACGQRGAGWRPGYKWQLHGLNAETFLRAVEPHLRIKRRQAEVALKFRNLGAYQVSDDVVEARSALREELLDLNRKGART